MSEFPSRLIEGYRAFRETRLAADAARYRLLAERGQRPEIMIIGCCDSRAAPETIFDAAPGEMFVHRNVANLVPPFEAAGGHHGTSAAIEFGVSELKVRHLVVMGHGRCGGVSAFLNGTDPASHFMGEWIALMAAATDKIEAEATDRQQAMEFASVRQSLDNLETFPFVRERVAAGALALHGAWFGIATGELKVLDPTRGAFRGGPTRALTFLEAMEDAEAEAEVGKEAANAARDDDRHDQRRRREQQQNHDVGQVGRAVGAGGDDEEADELLERGVVGDVEGDPPVHQPGDEGGDEDADEAGGERVEADAVDQRPGQRDVDGERCQAGENEATPVAKRAVVDPTAFGGHPGAHAARRFGSISLRLTSTSAIWTAFKAAPFLRLSETTHSMRPLSTVGSSRMRLM